MDVMNSANIALDFFEPVDGLVGQPAHNNDGRKEINGKHSFSF